MNVAQKTLEHVGLLLKNSKFIENHRLKPGAFTRRRKLPFERIVGTLIHLVKNSLQIICNKLGDYLHMDDPASKQALSQARSRFSYTCFQAITDVGLKIFYEEDTKGIWNGYRVFAADGSTLRLPESSDTLAYFGRHNNGIHSSECPVMGVVSEFTDVISGLIVEADLLPWGTPERTAAKAQFEKLVNKVRLWCREKLLFIYDRGYPSKEFISMHLKFHADFIFRIPRNFNTKIDDFVKSGASEITLELYPDLPPLRIVTFRLSSGEQEILLTSLVDNLTISSDDLFDLYATRWRAMEEGYKRQKIQFELQNWASESVLGVLQEYWAMIYISNLINVSCYELEGPTIPGDNPKKRLNRSVLIGSMRVDVLKTLTGDLSGEEFIKKFKKLAERAKVSVRPGRSYSRAGVGKIRRSYQIPRVC